MLNFTEAELRKIATDPKEFDAKLRVLEAAHKAGTIERLEAFTAYVVLLERIRINAVRRFVGPHAI